MQVVILTGMSGAGKTVAANYLEDMGYFCVDNAPLQMLKSMMKTFLEWEKQDGVLINKVAFVIDARSLSMVSPKEFDNAFKDFKKKKIPLRIIFLESSDQKLISRYKQSRRNHPLAKEQGITEALREEREMMSNIKEKASDVIDTTNIEGLELRDMLYKMLCCESGEPKLTVLVQSFGFKYGVPLDCDNIIDVRFIPNPYYNPELKNYCGLDKKIKDYVFSFEETNSFIEKIMDLMKFAIPYYVREGKVRIHLGIGCTGGRHRSVAIAESLGKMLKNESYSVTVFHRDLDKDLVTKSG